jgi:hypothetical protein
MKDGMIEGGDRHGSLFNIQTSMDKHKIEIQHLGQVKTMKNQHLTQNLSKIHIYRM